jgi:transglutaminase-like putative cysteine protease
LWTLSIAVLDKAWHFPAVIAELILTTIIVLFVIKASVVSESIRSLFLGELTELSKLDEVSILLCFAPISVLALYALPRFWFRCVLSGGWLIFWVTASFLELSPPKISLCAMVPILLFTLVESMHRLRKSGQKEHLESIFSGLMGLFTAGVILLMVLPTSENPYGWPIVHAIWNKIETICYNIETNLFYREGGTDEFGLSFNGFSDDAKTGNGLTDENSAAISVTSKENSNGKLYLIGNIWDTFTGSGWSSTVSEEDSELLNWNLDTAEHLYALYRYQQNEENTSYSTGSFFKENNVYITYDNVNTKTLFTSANSLQVTTEDERFPWKALAGGAVFDYVQTSGTYYRLYYLEQNSRLLSTLLQASEGYRYGSNNSLAWRAVYSEYRHDFVLSMKNSTVLEPLFSKRHELIQNVYTTLPDDISDEVMELAQEITAGCTSDYEKLKAIESYLHDNYTYTTSPDPVPKGSSFLDYVLFDTREGYCTWYATAATILSRCVGIPARYVQGYCVRLTGGETQVLDGTDSHAWCEGYISGYGWVTIEPTPSYSLSGSGWSYEDEKLESAYIGGDDEEYFDEWEEDYDIYFTSDYEAPEVAEEEKPVVEESSNTSVIRIVFITIFVVALVLACFVGGKFEKERRQYEEADYSGKAVIDLKRLLKRLNRRGFPRRSEESLKKYFNRLMWIMYTDPKLTNRVVSMYEEIFFADRSLTEEEWQETQKFVASFKRRRR